MTRIGLLSDTHAYWDEKYLEYFEPCDEIWHAGDIGSIEQNLPFIRRFKSSHYPQCRGFSATTWPKQCYKFILMNIKIHMI